MGVLEIVLLIIGGIIFIVSFILPQGGEKLSEESKKLAKEEIKTMVSKEMNGVKSHVDDVVDEAVGYAVEKTERSLERLTNEKIMAVSEYSDTVMNEIHRNHEEVMFLYDMLNDKHTSLKNTVSEVNKTVKEAEEKAREAENLVNTFQRLTPEAAAAAPEDGVADFRQSETTSYRDNTQLEKLLQTVEEPAVVEETEEFSEAADEMGEGHNSKDRILELYKQGKTAVAIAKELDLGVGEVKLVIDLHKNA